MDSVRIRYDQSMLFDYDHILLHTIIKILDLQIRKKCKKKKKEKEKKKYGNV